MRSSASPLCFKICFLVLNNGKIADQEEETARKLESITKRRALLDTRNFDVFTTH